MKFWLFLAATAALAAPRDLPRTLKGIENRYNNARTLEVAFEQTVSVNGRGRRTESGKLSLRKPGRMRWDYSSPAGKLFLSDGKLIYFYSPAAHRVEKMKVKETEDMRAPLAFLLGRLDFNRDFRSYLTTPEGDNLRIKAMPKSDKLPYSEVEFVATPDHHIRSLTVTGRDQSIMEFRFSDEKINPSLSDRLFEFTAPAGAEIVDMTSSN